MFKCFYKCQDYGFPCFKMLDSMGLHKSIIYGCVVPWSPVFMDVNMPEYFQKYIKRMGICSGLLLQISKFEKRNFYRCWKRRAPTNDADPLNTISQFLVT